MLPWQQRYIAGKHSYLNTRCNVQTKLHKMETFTFVIKLCFEIIAGNIIR